MEGGTPFAVSPLQGYLGLEARLHWTLGSLTFPAPWPATLSTLGFFGDGRGTSSFPQPYPQAGQYPCLPRQHAQPLAAETQDPIDSMPVFYDITWWGCLWGQPQGPEQTLDDLGGANAKLQGAWHPCTLPGCPIPARTPKLSLCLPRWTHN